MLKIYFAGSIRGGRKDAERYTEIIILLRSFGLVLTEHIGSDKLLEDEKQLTDIEIHDRDMEWLYECDVVCAEVTQPSLGVGYELALAMQANKKILCLFNDADNGRLSAMITGNKHYEIVNYQSINELEVMFERYFKAL